VGTLLSIQSDADLDLGVDALFDTRDHAGLCISMRVGNALYSACAVVSVTARNNGSPRLVSAQNPRRLR
jgi:hypothetical protein